MISSFGVPVTRTSVLGSLQPRLLHAALRGDVREVVPYLFLLLVVTLFGIAPMTEITRHALSTVAWNQAWACATLRFGIPRSPIGNRCGAIGVCEADG